MTQTGIFEGRTRVRYGYSCFGWTRGGGGTQILCGATDAVSVPSYDSVNVALPDVPSSYHLVVGFEASQDGNQDVNIFTGAQRMGGQWHAKAFNYGDTIQGKLTWVAFP